MPWIKDENGNEILVPGGGADYFKKKKAGAIPVAPANSSTGSGWTKDAAGNDILIPAGGADYFQRLQSQQPQQPAAPNTHVDMFNPIYKLPDVLSSNPPAPLGPGPLATPQPVVPMSPPIEDIVHGAPAATMWKPGQPLNVKLPAQDTVPEFVDDALMKVGDTDAFQSLMTGLYSDLPSIYGGAAEYVGNKMDWDSWRDIGKRSREFGENYNELAMRDADWGGNPVEWKGWRSLVDPQFYTHNVMRGVPLVLSMVPAALVGGGLGGAAAGAAGLGSFGTGVAATIGGTLMSRPLESAMEAGSTYNDALRRGMTEEEAASAADETFLKNLGLAATDIPELAAMFMPAPAWAKKLLGTAADSKLGKVAMGAGRIGTAAAFEGVEEGIQEVIQRQSLGDEVSFDPAMQESIAQGAILGGWPGVAGTVMHEIKNRVYKNVPPETRHALETVVAEKVDSGVPVEEAVKQMFDEFAGTEEGQQIVKDATQQVVDDVVKVEEQVKKNRKGKKVEEFTPPVTETVSEVLPEVVPETIQHEAAADVVPEVEIPPVAEPVTVPEIAQVEPEPVQSVQPEIPIPSQVEQRTIELEPVKPFGGKPFQAEMYQGRGKSRREIYNWIETPIAGEGQYYAFSEEDAKRYGDKISKHAINIDNPQVITNDAEWRKLTKEAGWEFPNPYGTHKEKAIKMIDALKQLVIAKGHDGLLVQMGKDDRAKTLRKVFGHDQVVVYEKPAPQQVQQPARESTQQAQQAPSTPAADMSSIEPGQKLNTKTWGETEVMEVKRNPKGDITGVVLKIKSGGTPTIGIKAFEKILLPEITKQSAIKELQSLPQESIERELLYQATEIYKKVGKISIPMIMQQMKLGYKQAKQLVDKVQSNVKQENVIAKDIVETGASEEYGLAVKRAGKKEMLKESKTDIAEEVKTPDITARAENISPKAARSMGEKLAKLLNTVLRAGRHKRGTVGTFESLRKAGKLKISKVDNWRVSGHELGHGIAFSLLNESNFKPDGPEMRSLADEMYPGKIPAGKKTQEGLAEFLMLWFADNKTARKKAPKTAGAIDSFLEANPNIAATFDELITIAEHDLEGDLLPQMANLIAKPGERTRLNLGDEYEVPWFKRIQFQVADYTIPLHDLYKAAVKEGFKGISPAKLAAISGSGRDKAINLFTNAARDEAGRFLLPGRRALGEIVDEAAKIPHGVQLFDWIYHALRYQERYEVMAKSEGKKYFELPKTKEYFDAVAKEARERYPSIVALIEDFAETLSEINLRLLVRGGVISEETAHTVKKGSKYYLPLYNVGRQGFIDTEAAGRRSAGQGVHRFKGHEGQTMNFIEASITRLYDTLLAVEVNKIMQSIEEALRQPNMGLFGDFPELPLISRLVNTKDLARQLQDALEGDMNIEDDGRIIRLFMPGGLKDLGPKETILVARNGGRSVYMRVAPDIYKAILSMRPISVDWISKTLAYLTQIGRFGALANVRYMSNAVARDVIVSKIQTKTRMGRRSLVFDFFKGVSTAIGLRPEVMDAYIQSGGYGSAPAEVINNILRSSVNDKLTATPVPGWKRTTTGIMARVVKTPLEALRILEEMPRVAEFEAVLKNDLKNIGVTYEDFIAGKVPDKKTKEVERALIEAAYASREILVNFGLHGIHEGFRKYARTVQFMQGSIQGIYRFGRQVKDKPYTTMMRAALYMLPLTLLAWALSNDDDKYRDMPSESRDRYWWIPVGEQFYIAVAKPYEYALPANMLERFLDWNYNTDDPNRRKPLQDMITALKTSFSVPMTSMLLSTVLSLYAGVDTFGNPIVPEREEGLLPEMQYGQGTSEFAIKMAEVTAVVMGEKTPSPREIDYFMKNAFGGIGKTATNILSNPLNPLKWLKGDDRSGVEYAPIIGSLIYGPAEGGSRIVDKFYDGKAKAERLYKSAESWQKQGIDIGKKLNQDDLRLILSIPIRNMFAKELADIRSAQREVAQRSDITPEQKRVFNLRMNWMQKLLAGYMYRSPIPTVSPEAGITDAHAQDILNYYDYKVEKTIQNALKKKGGPL